MLELLQTSPLAFAILAVILLCSLSFHELGHAWVADRFGDKTACNLGRITLNPLKHLDPIGTILLFVVGFGWAKPVPIQPQNFSNYRWGLFWVSLAGVIVNFLMALAALLVLGWLGVRVLADGGLTVLPDSLARNLAQGEVGGGLLTSLLIAVRLNLILVVFNLLPIPPLDGSKVVAALAPQSWQKALWQLERYGFLLVIVILVLFDNQIFSLIDTVSSALMRIIL